MLPKVADYIMKAPKTCINLSVGVFCGAAQAAGLEIFTKNSVNEALNMKGAADACLDELSIKLTSEHDEISKIMTAGGKNAIAKAKAIMKSSGVDEKCIQIFGLVYSKAEELGALETIKDACAFL